MQVVGAAVNNLFNELGDFGTGSPLSGEGADLGFRRDLASQEKPEETLRKRLLATRGLGKKLLALGDGLAAEADALLSIEDGALPDKALDTTGTAIDLIKSDLVDNLGAMFLSEGLDLLDLLREELSKALLESLGLR